jgi:hypothetical protein
MSLDKLESVPIDTHVISIANNIYKFNNNNDDDKNVSKKKPNLSKALYSDISNKFQQLWRIYPGWAQTVMFIGDFKEFQTNEMQIKLEPKQIKQEGEEIKKVSSKKRLSSSNSSLEIKNLVKNEESLYNSELKVPSFKRKSLNSMSSDYSLKKNV